jgi:hypothetical protein
MREYNELVHHNRATRVILNPIHNFRKRLNGSLVGNVNVEHTELGYFPGSAGGELLIFALFQVGTGGTFATTTSIYLSKAIHGRTMVRRHEEYNSPKNYHACP